MADAITSWTLKHNSNNLFRKKQVTKCNQQHIQRFPSTKKKYDWSFECVKTAWNENVAFLGL